MSLPKLLDRHLTPLLSLFLFASPLLAQEEQEFVLDINKFGAPNSSVNGWTESGMGTAKLTYTHESGVTVTFRTINDNSGVIVRTYIDGVGALGIDDPQINYNEMMSAQITGIKGTAEVSRIAMIGLVRKGSTKINAPGLVFFQQNGGKVAGGPDTTATHDDEDGSTRIVGKTEDPMQVSSVEFFGASERKGFSVSEAHVIRIRNIGEKPNSAFISLSFFATPS